MKDVALTQEAGELLELYTEVYEKRYRLKPMLALPYDTTLAKDMVRMHGYSKAADFVIAYMKSEYFNFVSKKHPLQALARDLNIVHMEMQSTVKRVPTTSIRIRCPHYCDSCGIAEFYVGDPNILSKRWYCDDCEKREPQ